jgi:hypothetical protein
VGTSIPSELLLKLIHATPEQLAVVERALMLAPDPPTLNGNASLGEIQLMFCELRREIVALREIVAAAPRPISPGVASGTRSFVRCGDFWKVIFDGHELHVEHSLGARYLDYLLHHPNQPISAYLDYLLHHPNQPISAFELELTIAPEKASARAVNSFGARNDSDAVRRSLRELDRLRAERDEAEQDGHYGKAAQLDAEIEALEAQLKAGRGQRKHDTGERARNNVRKAIGAVLRSLRSGDAGQKAFAAHLSQFVSTGYTCMYQQPPGSEWA